MMTAIRMGNGPRRGGGEMGRGDYYVLMTTTDHLFSSSFFQHELLESYLMEAFL